VCKVGNNLTNERNVLLWCRVYRFLCGKSGRNKYIDFCRGIPTKYKKASVTKDLNKTRCVSREMRLVSRKVRCIWRDCGNLHVSGTVYVKFSFFFRSNGKS